MKKLVSITLVLNTLLFAALPPQVYQQLQKYAPESVHILVDHVTKYPTANPHEFKVTVQATILHVIRTQSNLKKGEKIGILYTTVTSRPRGWVGPSSLPVLHEGEQYNAYLQKDDIMFIPAAKGKSFIHK